MKRIIITGKDSYIGDSVQAWLLREPEEYQVFTLDMCDDIWKRHDFSSYDCVFHVAGIVHDRHSKKNEEIYYRVNRDLALEVANKARLASVRHFVFMSTMSVYGEVQGEINQSTKENPETVYGKSKLEAEKRLGELENDHFMVTMVRAPMVYGPNCPGNYKRLAKLALRLPFIPDFDNQRSMIFIDNLSEFIKLVINAEVQGVVFPQNKDFVSTTNMMAAIAKVHGKKTRYTRALNWLIKCMLPHSSIVRKMFGTLTYDRKLPGGPFNLKYETLNHQVLAVMPKKENGGVVE